MERDIGGDVLLLALLCNESTGGIKGASSFTSTATSAAPSAPTPTSPTSASFSSLCVLLCVRLPYPPSSTETTRPEQQRSAMRIISVVIHSKSEGLKSMPTHVRIHIRAHMYVHT